MTNESFIYKDRNVLFPELKNLSCMWQRHRLIIAFSHYLIIESRMTVIKIIGKDMLSKYKFCFFDIVQIGFFILEVSELVFNYNNVKKRLFCTYPVDTVLFI